MELWDVVIKRLADDATLLNVVLATGNFGMWRLYAGAQKARDEDRRAELAARQADADAHAEAMSKVTDALASIRVMVELIKSQTERRKA